MCAAARLRGLCRAGVFARRLEACGIARLCGTASVQNRNVPPPQTSPAGVNARPTMRGTRAVEQGQEAAARFGGAMQASPPAKHRAGSCRVLKGHLCGKAAVHPSGCALRRIQLPLQGSLFKRQLPIKASPVRGGAAAGGGGVRRLALQVPFRPAAIPAQHLLHTLRLPCCTWAARTVPQSPRSTYYTLGGGGRPVAGAGVGQRPNRFMAPCRSTVQPQHRTRQRTAASTAP